MPKRIGTARRKTRTKLRLNIDQRGKLNINSFLQKFETGERVVMKINPQYQKGMYHPRFYGKSAVVVEKRGHCFVVSIMDGGKAKRLIAHPAHLKRQLK